MTIGIGPLKPGPKPSASRSYARRAVCSSGCVPWSDAPSRTSAEPAARTSPADQKHDEDRLVVPCHEATPARDERLLARGLGVVDRRDGRRDFQAFERPLHLHEPDDRRDDEDAEREEPETRPTPDRGVATGLLVCPPDLATG